MPVVPPSPGMQVRVPESMAILVDPKNDIPAVENDIRVEDYLNDKIQTRTDLGTLASLIATVDQQKNQLDQQLQDARAKLESTKKASAEHAAQMLQRTQQFDEQYADIQNRLMAMTSSVSPEEATERLKGPMEKLRRVEMATLYVKLLKEVDELTFRACSHLPAEPKKALIPYTCLKELAITLRQLQEPAEGAAVHLVKYVDDTSTSLWLEMKRIMSDDFEAVLKKSKWPAEAREPTREWSDCFGRLLDLQGPEIMAAREPLILLPMSVLAKSFVQEFRYHFFSDKATNAPQRPGDYFFEYFVGTVKSWDPYLRENIAPVLAAHFRGNILAGNTLYIDPVSGLITALLPIMKEKTDLVITGISGDPKLLSKFIKQLLNFDETVRDSFNYTAGNIDLGWKGLTWDVLDTWFDKWLEVEKEFSLQRYRGIIQSSDSGVIDYDSTMPGRTRPTFGAMRVVDLIDSVTQSYDKLRKFSNKVRFLIEIQAEILDQYQGRLNESLDAYNTITNPVARKFHGISKEQQAELEGVRGLQSLCKVYGSADYIINMLREWADSELFIDLWNQLQSRAKRTNVNDNLAGAMSYTEVKDSTSTAVGSDADGSVFDMTITGYSRLRSRSEEYMIGAIKYNNSISFRHYLTRAQWTTVGDDSTTVGVTPELDQPLQGLKDYLAFLTKTLAVRQFRHIWRDALDSLQDLIFSELLLKQDFTTLGAARLTNDIHAIERLMDRWADMGMPKLRQGIQLLSLPLSAEDGVTLTEASGAVYSTNTAADDILTKLGLDQISRADARGILARRVEASE